MLQQIVTTYDLCTATVTIKGKTISRDEIKKLIDLINLIRYSVFVLLTIISVKINVDFVLYAYE